MTKISESFSEDKIDAFVDKLLENQSINMSLMPDYIEKQLYKNVFSICLGILDTVLDTVKIEFMGHKIVIDLSPDVPVNDDVEAIAPPPPKESDKNGF